MADRGKKGKTKIQKPEYLKNEKSFLDEIKNMTTNDNEWQWALQRITTTDNEWQ